MASSATRTTCSGPIGLHHGITHLIARSVVGTGTYSQLLYTSAVTSAPAWIINRFLGLIPVVNGLTIPLGIYVLVLDMLAVRAVHQLGWGQAILSSFSIWVLLLIFAAFVSVVILARWAVHRQHIFR